MPEKKKKRPILMRDLVGKCVVLERMLDTDRDTGPVRVRLKMGTNMKVSSVGRGFNLETGPCPHCGIDVYVTDVRKTHVLPEDDPDAANPIPAAFWTQRGNSHICSSCSCPIPEGPWPYYCPNCGSRMQKQPDSELNPFTGPAPAAFWTSQEEKNDHLWARCSECGFTVENYKAVKQGSSSDDYVDVRWPFCPKCGRRMGVMGIAQKKDIRCLSLLPQQQAVEERSDANGR